MASVVEDYAEIKRLRDYIRRTEDWNGFDPYNPPPKPEASQPELPIDRQMWNHYMSSQRDD